MYLVAHGFSRSSAFFWSKCFRSLVPRSSPRFHRNSVFELAHEVSVQPGAPYRDDLARGVEDGDLARREDVLPDALHELAKDGPPLAHELDGVLLNDDRVLGVRL